MAYGVVHQFPGGTREQYEASIAAVHPSGGLPAGQIYHAAGPSADGWTIIAVHESKESWETFRDGILMPRHAAGHRGRVSVASHRVDLRRLQDHAVTGPNHPR